MSQLCVAAVATNDQAAAPTPSAGESRRRDIGGFTDNFYASVGRGAPFKSPADAFSSKIQNKIIQ
jgi:hypothetical protein